MVHCRTVPPNPSRQLAGHLTAASRNQLRSHQNRGASHRYRPPPNPHHRIRSRPSLPPRGYHPRCRQRPRPPLRRPLLRCRRPGLLRCHRCRSRRRFPLSRRAASPPKRLPASARCLMAENLQPIRLAPMTAAPIHPGMAAARIPPAMATNRRGTISRTTTHRVGRRDRREHSRAHGPVRLAALAAGAIIARAVARAARARSHRSRMPSGYRRICFA